MKQPPKYPLNEAETADLRKRFTYHSPIAGQQERYVELRDTAFDLAVRYMELVPPGRERALAITNLEQSNMWANAGIARSGE